MSYTVKDKYKDLVLNNYTYSLGDMNSKQIAGLSIEILKKYFTKKKDEAKSKTKV